MTTKQDLERACSFAVVVIILLIAGWVWDHWRLSALIEQGPERPSKIWCERWQSQAPSCR